MSHALPPEIAARRDGRGSRVGDLIRRLSSASDGEIIATVYALRRVLESHGADVHALAEHVETANGGLTEEYKQKIRAEIENARAVGYAGKLEWTEVALFVQREKHRLDSKHHEFIDDMASRTAYLREPTLKQHKYLHSLFYKLGGKII
jgi:hypothetical protein